jgi:hypothetical protein
MLVCIGPSGERFPFSLKLGTPHFDPKGNCACPVALEGLERPFLDIAGEDSLQSLMLARRFAYLLLSARVEPDRAPAAAATGNASRARKGSARRPKK